MPYTLRPLLRITSSITCYPIISHAYVIHTIFSSNTSHHILHKQQRLISSNKELLMSPELKKAKLNMSDSPLTICTHNGSFHADEALAVYILRLLPKFSNANLVRSRNPDDWAAADIVVDVGGQYDGTKFFDHHQRGFEEVFGEVNGLNFKTKLSSAGLVYKHFGKEAIGQILNTQDDSVKDLLYSKVYADFIEALDANDNGINKYAEKDLKERFKDKSISLPSIVANLNPFWTESDTPADFDRQFLVASELMGNAFKNVVRSLGVSWLPAKNVVEKSFASRFDVDPSGKVLILEQFVPWKEHLYTIEKENGKQGEILYVLFADSGSNWRISTVPITSTSFENRKPLPEAWRGLRDDALSEATGVPGCVFIHAAGFIGGAKTQEAVLKLAKMSLEN